MVAGLKHKIVIFLSHPHSFNLPRKQAKTKSWDSTTHHLVIYSERRQISSRPWKVTSLLTGDITLHFTPFKTKQNLNWENSSVNASHKVILTGFSSLNGFVHQAKPLFGSKDKLLAWMASLPTGPKWHSTTLEITGYPTVQPIQLIWRNGLDVVEDLFANPIFANHMTYDPHIVVDGAKQAFEIQDQLPIGATIVPIIVASDKMPMTWHTGGLEMHPIFVSLANIQSDVQMRATSHTWRCVGFMLIPKFSDVHTDYQTILSQRLFHKCMDIIFADAKVAAMAGKFMPDPSGHVRHCFTPLAAYTADLPKQQAIACVSKVASPVTLATSQSFGDSHRHMPCTKEHTLSVIYDICQCIDPWRLREFQEEAKAHLLSGVHQPFWRNWRFTDPACFLAGEILHTCHKFFFDHPFKWSKELVGKDELDAQFQSHHKRVGTRHFSSGVCQMKQMTGWEHRDLQCTLVPSIAGVVPPPFIHAIHALIDFIYKAQSPVYTDSSIDSMVASLREFHDHKQAVLDAGARQGTKGMIDNFLIPKLELLQSFAAFTKDIGTLIQWTADVTKRLLITHCKLPFDRTSRQSCTFTEQIVDILNCEESMQRFKLYLFLRMHDTPLTNAIVTEEQEITETDPALAWIARITPGDPNQWCFVGPHPVRNHFLKGILSSTATTAFHITVTPDRAKMSVNDIRKPAFSLIDLHGLTAIISCLPQSMTYHMSDIRPGRSFRKNTHIFHQNTNTNRPII
ncbi:uncharacterized protein F5147DRAFT_774333 [Suillus discolor]|uniref:Uncharacterized protein n=1 Tax=Suillus discolor TaxID=1912936 RepID=A0A9P7JTK8_9AGAM|nr:uncharacterized protein F5147DRAFT_774333 [Suillus discolor]KAG2107501.1 hypothetical protein F5147DRAFT_774333 [Suillus discolor]